MFLRDNLFIENLLSETSRTLSMDTHYPESMDDLADCDLEEESEEQLRHQQELVAQALEIEREFWNCDWEAQEASDVMSSLLYPPRVDIDGM